MSQSLPTPSMIAELEARQDEALRMLGELEKNVERALAEFTAISKRAGDLRIGTASEPATVKFPATQPDSVPAVKVA